MKRKPLKIIAIVLAVVIVGVTGFFANAIFGNPLSKHLANRSAEKYISEVYPEKYFIVRNVKYDFKVGGYYAKIYSPVSIDSNFELRIDFLGKVHYDTYEYEVTTGWNTADRINADYRNAVDSVLNSPLFPYNSDIGYGDIEFIPEEYKDNFDVPSYAIITETLVPDAIYDINEMGRKAGHICVYLNADETTEEQMAKVLLDLKNAMDKAGVTFCSVDCQLENNDAETWLEVRNFLYSDIYEEDLIERVKKSVKETKEYYEAIDKEAEVVLDEK